MSIFSINCQCYQCYQLACNLHRFFITRDVAIRSHKYLSSMSGKVKLSSGIHYFSVTHLSIRNHHCHTAEPYFQIFRQLLSTRIARVHCNEESQFIVKGIGFSITEIEESYLKYSNIDRNWNKDLRYR